MENNVRKLCIYNRNQQCLKGSTCTFAHVDCKFGAKCRREVCIFGHPAKTTPFPAVIMKPAPQEKKPDVINTSFPTITAPTKKSDLPPPILYADKVKVSNPVFMNDQVLNPLPEGFVSLSKLREARERRLNEIFDSIPTLIGGSWDD
jgi:hypothetical protein